MTAAATNIEIHLRGLEERIVRLSAQFMAETDDGARYEIQRELNALQIALEHYKTALKIEGEI
ncbi:MAG: hypothetical protein NVS9B15_05030 [Acidobacteriaceae bacterium]